MVKFVLTVWDKIGIACHWIKGQFVNLEKKERLRKEQEQLNASKNPSVVETSSKNNSLRGKTTKVTKIGKKEDQNKLKNDPAEMKRLENGLTPTVLMSLKNYEWTKHAMEYPVKPPERDYEYNDYTRVEGILVNGPRYVPQFIPDGYYDVDEDRYPDYPLYDFGFIIQIQSKNRDKGTITVFYPNSVYTVDDRGRLLKRLDQDQKARYRDAPLSVLEEYYKQMPILLAKADEKNEQKDLALVASQDQAEGERKAHKEDNEKYEAKLKKKDEEQKADAKKRLEIEKKESRKDTCVWINRISGVVIILLLIALILYLCGVFDPKKSTDDQTRALPQAGAGYGPSSSRNGTGSNNHNNNNNNNNTGSMGKTTTQKATTTTRAYPVMTAVERLPIAELPKQTFEIVSSLIEADVGGTDPKIVFANIRVIYMLNITSRTDAIHLHCAVYGVGHAAVNGTEIEGKSYNESTGVLTLNLQSPVEQGTVKLLIPYTASPEAFEKLSFPCGLTTCNVLVNHKLSLFVPHFNVFNKHKWSFKIKSPANIKVVTNSKAYSTLTAGVTTYEETSTLLPTELSFVIIENFSKQPTGTNIESYWSNGTEVSEVTVLSTTLEKALTSNPKPPLASNEMFFILVIPAMENYKFYGRNVALVGTSLLRSNMEIKQNFVWRWIFRTAIYSKVTSSDRNPSWIYESSAVFLSTSFKSNNKEMWKKHFYGLTMESGLEVSSNKSITDPDELRYFEKTDQIAKISTILEMVTSLGSSVSGDTLANLDHVRNNTLSAEFFFVKAQMELGNGVKLDVNKMISCYIDSPTVPHVHVNRTSGSAMVIQRHSGEIKEGCDMNLWLVKGKLNNNAVNKEYKLLAAAAETVQLDSDSPVLLSGDSPSSPYRYTLDQHELEKLLDASVMANYDNASLILLASNVFYAAFEGELSYEVVESFMKIALDRKIVSVDETIDSWMWTLKQSRNADLTSFSQKVIASVLNATGNASDSSAVTSYIINRFEKSLQGVPLFVIEKASSLMKYCGKFCLDAIFGKYRMKLECVTGSLTDCSFDPHIMEMLVCSKIVLEFQTYYQGINKLYGNCTGKPCLLPTLRGILCNQDQTKLQEWLQKTSTMDTSNLVDRQVILAVFEGLASNAVSKPLMFPYLMENWHLIHQKFSKFPGLLGEIIDTFGSTISTPEQLIEFKQFIQYHGAGIEMYKEFQEQIKRAEKAVNWNQKYSAQLTKLFG